MSKLSKSALLLLAAFFVFGFSIVANAAPKAKPQVITSAPTMADLAWCMVNNTTDASIDAAITIVWQENIGGAPGEIVFEEYQQSIPAREIMPQYSTVTEGPGIYVYCTVSWVGNPGDLRGNMCGYNYVVTTDLGIMMCVDLY